MVRLHILGGRLRRFDWVRGFIILYNFVDNGRMISMMSLFFLFLRSSSLFRLSCFVFLLFEFVFLYFVSFIIQWYVYWSSIVDGSTFIAVFLICPDNWAHKNFLKRLHETIEEKLASISDLGKLVVSSPRWKSISKIPETLHIILMETGYSYFRRRADNDSQLFTSFIEIFKKRRSSLDLISIVREFKRTWPDNLEVKDNLSTLPRF